MPKYVVSIALLCLMIFVTSPSADDVNAQQPAGRFDGVFNMAIHLNDRYLDYLAKPETTKRLATFQKNYYDSLIEAGFDKDQAIALVRAFGNPMADMIKSQ